VLFLISFVFLNFIFYDIVLKKTPLLSFLHYIWFLPWLFSSSFSFRGLARGKNIFLRREIGWNFGLTRSLKNFNVRMSNYINQGTISYFLKRILLIFFMVIVV
jgi:hypothetical protein